MYHIVNLYEPYIHAIIGTLLITPLVFNVIIYVDGTNRHSDYGRSVRTWRTLMTIAGIFTTEGFMAWVLLARIPYDFLTSLILIPIAAGTVLTVFRITDSITRFTDKTLVSVISYIVGVLIPYVSITVGASFTIAMQ